MTSEKIIPKKNMKKLIEHELDELQGIDTVYIDISKQTAIADGMWVTTGRSRRHTQAIADNIMEKLKANTTPALSMTGYENGEWILIDCDNYLIHILMPVTRELYRLEDLWQTAENERRT